MIARLSNPIERRTRTTVDTIMLTPSIVEKWKSPPFQRPVRENEKVIALSEALKEDGGVLPGILTLGILDNATWIVDGQHRIKAFIISGLAEGYSDVRTHHFKTMAEMGEEFVQLNSQLVKMRPDDILRGFEASVPALLEIRKKCPFVGYDQVRRQMSSPLVSMSALLRVWRGSAARVPTANVTGMSSMVLAQALTDEETDNLIAFLTEAKAAFGNEPQYARLWGSLNLIMCMWLFRNTVLSQWSSKTPKLNRDLFRKCLMSVSSDSHYLDWLVGRQTGERDRAPAYGRVKAMFASRLRSELNKAVSLPQPDWAHQ